MLSSVNSLVPKEILLWEPGNSSVSGLARPFQFNTARHTTRDVILWLAPTPKDHPSACFGKAKVKNDIRTITNVMINESLRIAKEGYN